MFFNKYVQKKAIKSEKYKNWLELKRKIGIETTIEKNSVKPVTGRTRHYRK